MTDSSRMSVALSSSDKAVLERTVEGGGGGDDDDDDCGDYEDAEEAFELEKCAGWIRQNELNNVALQFPDSLLKHAPKVASWLEGRLEQRYSKTD